MKKYQLIIVAVATIVATLAAVSIGNAQDVGAVVTGVGISTNSAGDLTYRPFGNEDLIKDCADEMGVTNLAGLHLIYDASSNALEVVSGTNDTYDCTALAFSGGVSLSNTNGTKSESQYWAFWEANTTPSGTLSDTELLYTYGPSNAMSSLSLSGELQIALPGSGTNAPVIYQARVVAGGRMFFPFISPVAAPPHRP